MNKKYFFFFSLIFFFTDICFSKKISSNFTIEKDSLTRNSDYTKAVFLFNSKKYSQTIKYSFSHLNKNSNSILKGSYLHLIGKAYKEKRDYYKSILYLKQAIVINNIKLKDSLVENYIEIARVYKKLGGKSNYLNAIEYLLTALNNGKISDNKKYLIFNNISNIYKGLGRYKNAFFYLNKSLKLAKIKKDSLKIQACLINFGTTHFKGVNTSRKKLIISENYYLEALKYGKIFSTKIYINLGIINYLKEQLKLALFYYNRALSNLLEIEFNAKELTLVPTKEQILSSKNKPLLLHVLLEKYYTFIKFNRQTKDKKYLYYALETIDASTIILDEINANIKGEKTILFWQNKASHFYFLGVHISALLNNSTKALHYIEKNKALLLLQNSQILKWKSQLPKKILNKIKQYKNKIAQLAIALEKKENDSIQNILFKQNYLLEALNDSITKVYPKKNTSTSTKIITLKKVQKSLDNNTVYLSYIWDKTENQYDALFGLLITKKQTKIFKINGLKAIETNVKNFRASINKPFNHTQDLKEFQKVAFTLYTKLFPIEIQPYIKDKKLIIILDSDLQNIPFEALITKKNSLSYLIKKNEISYAYSISFLKENSLLKRNPIKKFIGFAPMSFKYDSLSNLKNSALEIAAINTHFTGDLFVNEKATKENFYSEINQSNILHLATHAEANTKETPWIAFKNQKLLLHELYTTHTQADLIVLSACNSTIGKMAQGEGVLSLARGFFYAGANTVVSSLWNVDDKATSKIMVNFYKNLHDNQTKSHALHNAKLQYIKTHNLTEASPFYWASFILIGDSNVMHTMTINDGLSSNFLIIFTSLLLIIFSFYRLQLKKK